MECFHDDPSMRTSELLLNLIMVIILILIAGRSQPTPLVGDDKPVATMTTQCLIVSQGLITPAGLTARVKEAVA